MPSLARQRGDTLLAVSHGILTPAQVVQMASRNSNEAQRTIPLSRLLEAAPGWDASSCAAALALVCAVCRCRASEHDHPVSWLLKPKTNGWRVLAFADATHAPLNAEHDDTCGPDSPWPGFPFTPHPKAAA